MVKLFVGNLPEAVDPHKLRQIFAQHIRVKECDVIKNYAFIHIDDVDEPRVDSVISRLNGYVFDGKTITLERSTSKLRQKPGMDNKCFRCGATDHKTPLCPLEEKKTIIGGVETIKIDLTGKRPATDFSSGPDAKRAYMTGPAGIDKEIAAPTIPELQPLYNSYVDSRNRYIYYRDRLVKEIQARSETVNYNHVPVQQQIQLQHNPAAVTAQQVAYVQQHPVQVQQQWTSVGGAAPYQQTQQTYLKAPYAAGVPQQQQPYAVGVSVAQAQPTAYVPGQPVAASPYVVVQQQQQPAVAQQQAGVQAGIQHTAIQSAPAVVAASQAAWQQQAQAAQQQQPAPYVMAGTNLVQQQQQQQQPVVQQNPQIYQQQAQVQAAGVPAATPTSVVYSSAPATAGTGVITSGAPVAYQQLGQPQPVPTQMAQQAQVAQAPHLQAQPVVQQNAQWMQTSVPASR